MSSDRASLWQRIVNAFRPRNALTSYPTAQGVSFSTGLWQWPNGDGEPDALSAVFACKDLIARLVSTLPVDEYVMADDGRLVELPARPDLLEEPEPGVELNDWLYAQIQAVLGTGMAFGLVTDAAARGDALQVASLDPDMVRVRRGEAIGDPPVYVVGSREVKAWPNGPLWVLHGYPVAGSPVSLSPIGLAMKSVRLGHAVRDFAAGYFADGSVPPGILKHIGMDPADPSSQEVAKTVQRQWVEAQRGNREPRVLMGGWEYDPIRIMAEESQFLQTSNANAIDVARYFGVGPEDIGASAGGGSVTYANVEQRHLQLLVRTIGPWVVRLERRMSRLRPPGHYVKFDIDGLLRTDANTRSRVVNDAIRAGRLSVNEARRAEGLAGIGPDGDRFLWPPFRAQLSTPEVDAGADQLSPSGDEG